MSYDSHTSNDFAQPAQVSTVPVTVSVVPESDTEIVRRYEPAVRRYCRSRTRSPEDADDAVQDTFMRFIRRGEGKVHNHEAWLITAAARACAQLNRRHSRDEERVSDARIWDGCMANEDERFSDRGVNDPERLTVEHLTISSLLRRLNERERLVVTHLYLMGADSEQVAKYLNVTPNNLRRIAFNARRHAQTILRGMERSESTADST
jgi:RNA polymerase sigma-70 factor (ECF subfamily)